MDGAARAERSVVVMNASGLHVGAAAQLVELANTFPCDIRIVNKGRDVNAKSTMGSSCWLPRPPRARRGRVVGFVHRGAGVPAPAHRARARLRDGDARHLR